GVRNAEGTVRRRPGAVDEEHDARRSVQKSASLDTLADIELSGLAVHRRRDRADPDVVIESDELPTVVPRHGRARHGGAGDRADTQRGDESQSHAVTIRGLTAPVEAGTSEM